MFKTNKIYIVSLEALPSRYTFHWDEFVPEQIADATGCEVIEIKGSIQDTSVTEGAFLNFASTNIWKNEQASEIAQMFSDNLIEDGAYFLFMDAWNPTAIEVRYMADLFGVDVRLGGIWHSGSYDFNDFLGRKIKNKEWSYAFERSLYHLYDHNFFATQYHQDLFEKTLGVSGKSNRVGFPMEYMSNIGLTPKPKENMIVFPHRISPEKQPELFRELASMLPEYEFVICQERNLTKDEYHDILNRAKIVFSANLQETLGIGIIEGMVAGAIPLVPNRLSYSEMYPSRFKYNEDNLEDLRWVIKWIMEHYISYETVVNESLPKILKSFFNGEEMYKTIKGAA